MSKYPNITLRKPHLPRLQCLGIFRQNEMKKKSAETEKTDIDTNPYTC